MVDLEIKPLVSIIITSFNREKFIEMAIQSALNQDYPNLEIIISDNNSTDKSDTIIKKYMHDKRIKYFVNDVNIGMTPNFKLATEQRAKGEYITYVSSDDYLLSDKFISNAVNLISKYPNIVLVIAKNSTQHRDNEQPIENDSNYMFHHEFMYGKEVFKLFPKWFSPGWGGALINRDKLIKTNVFESKAQSFDYEANLKMMLQGNLAFIKEPSYVVRNHYAQASGFMTYETHVNNFDFIERTYYFAKKINIDIELESWRKKVYIIYLSRVARKFINREDEFKKLLVYIKKEKKIQLNIFKNPKRFMIFTSYKNYKKISFLVKIIYPKMYRSIEEEIN